MPLAAIGLAGLLPVLASTAAVAARPPSACLVPEETLIFVSVLDVPDAKARFARTALGRLLEDPAMRPVVADILNSIDAATAPLRESVGLTTDDLLNIPQGELTLAVIPREDGEPAPVLLIDTGGEASSAKRLVQAIVERIEQAGNRRSEKVILETPITIFEDVGRGQQDIAFFKKEETLVWSNNPGSLERVLTLWEAQDAPTLANRPDFAAIMQRSRRLNPKPQAIWYVNPLAIFEDRARDRLDMQVALMMLPALGLDGVKAVGGAVELDAGPYDSLWHAHLVLDKPREGVVAMVKPKSGRMTPPDWVPGDAAEYLTIHWDLQATLDTLRTLFDTFRGKGSLDEFITARLSGPLGVDLLGEALPALGGRIIWVRWIEKPIVAGSEAFLLALELLPEANAQALLEKSVQKNGSRLMRRQFAGVEYFEFVSRPSLEAETPRQPRRVPCFGIIGDWLIVADRESLLKAVVMTARGGTKRLAEAADFQQMIGQMDQLAGGSAPVMVRFQRPAERTAAWFEPLRQQNAEEIAGRRARRNPLQALESSIREHPLPPFLTFEKYFPPSGAVLLDDDGGLHYTSFTLKNPPP